jgi:hypothetical protein
MQGRTQREAQRLGDSNSPPMQRLAELLRQQARATSLAERDRLAREVRDWATEMRRFYTEFGPGLLRLRQAQAALKAGDDPARKKQIDRLSDALGKLRRQLAAIEADTAMPKLRRRAEERQIWTGIKEILAEVPAP